MAKNSVSIKAAKGFLAGYLALQVMEPVTEFLYDHEDPKAKKLEDEVRGGKAAYAVAAEKLSDLLHLDLSKKATQSLSVVLHVSLGLSVSILYAFTRRENPKTLTSGMLQGVGLGAAVFLVADEGLNWVMGFSPPPQKFPWQAHARGAIAHLVYGLAAESVFRGLEKLEDESVNQFFAQA